MSRAPVAMFPRAAIALLTVIAGCTITPIRQADQSGEDVSVPPDTLAFNDSAAPAGTKQTSALTEVEAAAWTIIASGDQVGVHSAPGSLYTRLGVLTADNDVIATGRRVTVGTEMWMEIHWANSTAWVPQSPFVPLQQ